MSSIFFASKLAGFICFFSLLIISQILNFIHYYCSTGKIVVKPPKLGRSEHYDNRQSPWSGDSAEPGRPGL